MAVKKKRKLSGLVAYSYIKDGSFRGVRGLRSGASPYEILLSTPPPPDTYSFEVSDQGLRNIQEFCSELSLSRKRNLGKNKRFSKFGKVGRFAENQEKS